MMRYIWPSWPSAKPRTWPAHLVLLYNYEEIYTFHRNLVNRLLDKKKQHFFREKVTESKSDYKCLFKLFNLLLNKSSEISPPTNKSSLVLVAEFSTYFTNTITSIRIKLVSDEGAQMNPIVDHSPCSVPSLKEILPATSEELNIIVNRSPTTNCDLDPVPTRLLKEQLDCIIPLMVDIVNKSLCSGVFPDCLKKAIVVLLLKKKSLGKNVYSNYRPVLNLAFLSNVIERVLAQRPNSHMDLKNMHEAMQSAYKKYHSTETALLYIQKGILNYIDQQTVVLLVFLDLSAAFDTIDHELLINRLSSRLGLSGCVLDWFRLYL